MLERAGQPVHRGPGTGARGRWMAGWAVGLRATRDRAARGRVAHVQAAVVRPQRHRNAVRRSSARGRRRRARSSVRAAVAELLFRPAALGRPVLRAVRGRRGRVRPRPGHAAPSYRAGRHREPRGRDAVRHVVVALGAVRPARRHRPVPLSTGMRGRRVRGPLRRHGPFVAVDRAAQQRRGRGRRPVGGVHVRGQAAKRLSGDRVELRHGT